MAERPEGKAVCPAGRGGPSLVKSTLLGVERNHRSGSGGQLQIYSRSEVGSGIPAHLCLCPVRSELERRGLPLRQKRLSLARSQVPSTC